MGQNSAEDFIHTGCKADRWIKQCQKKGTQGCYVGKNKFGHSGRGYL